MSTLFEDLYEGLQEAIAYTNGTGDGKETTYTFEPVQSYSSKDIKRIRNNSGMTQSVFAAYFGVSPKTVEAWECGRTHPTGPANRLLGILESGMHTDLAFVKVN